MALLQIGHHLLVGFEHVDFLLARSVELVQNQLGNVSAAQRHKVLLMVIEAQAEDPLDRD